MISNLVEIWSQPSIGHVLQGDVADVADWLQAKQYIPAVCIADPWYGDIVGSKDVADVTKWLGIIRSLEPFACPIYWWGGIGKPGHRPLLEFLLALERETQYRARDWITWRKRRGYGKSHDYLFVREECLLLTFKGEKPAIFNIPLSTERRGYKGYNASYPAKSDFKRITNVWEETELFSGKVHKCQKAAAVVRRPIEVHTQEKDLVLDLFSGSGETSVQAMKLNRNFVAVEIDPVTCQQIAARLTMEHNKITRGII